MTTTITSSPTHDPAPSSGPARRRRLGRLAVPAVLALALTVSACGSDDDTSATTSNPSSTAPATEPGAVAIDVRAVDFSYEDLPDRVPAGTRIHLVNDADTEVHELVAVRLADDEQRSVDELMALPEEEAQALLGGDEPALVVMAAPGEEEMGAVGSGTLDEPGRYLVLCSVPTGSDASILDAPPQESDAPPHFAHGMYAELIVE